MITLATAGPPPRQMIAQYSAFNHSLNHTCFDFPLSFDGVFDRLQARLQGFGSAGVVPCLSVAFLSVLLL